MGLFDDVLNDGGAKKPAPISAGSGLFDDVLSKPDPSSTARRVVGDTGISLLKGAISVPEAAVGIADLATGGYAGKAAEAIGFRPKEAKSTLDEFYTPEQKEANRKVQEAKGFLPTIGAAVENPSVIAQTVAESLPSMGAGAVLGRGALALAPKLGAVGAGAIGEGGIGAGLAAEGIRQQTADGTLSAKQAGAALASGVGTAALGAAGGKIAQKAGIGDIDTLLVGGTAQAGTRSLPVRMAGGAVSEGLLEELPQSMQEQAWQNVALDRPVMEGVPEAGALGALAGGVMGIGGGIISGPAQKPAGALSKTVEAGKSSGAVLALPNLPNETLIVFPDGSTGTRKQMDEYIASLSPEQRPAVMAKLLYGDGTPPSKISDPAAINAEWNQFLNDEANHQIGRIKDQIGRNDANEKARGILAQVADEEGQQQADLAALPSTAVNRDDKPTLPNQAPSRQGAVSTATPQGIGDLPVPAKVASTAAVNPALQAKYDAAKAAGDQDAVRKLAHEINSNRQPAAKVPPAKTEQAAGLSLGVAPNSAEPITVKDGVVHIGAYAAQDFDSGEDVRVSANATPHQIRDALAKAGVIGKGQKVFGLPKDDSAAGQNPAKAEQTPSKPDQAPPDLITLSGGRPYTSENAAKQGAKKNGVTDTHEVVPADDGKGFVLRRKATTQEEGNAPIQPVAPQAVAKAVPADVQPTAGTDEKPATAPARKADSGVSGARDSGADTVGKENALPLPRPQAEVKEAEPAKGSATTATLANDPDNKYRDKWFGSMTKAKEFIAKEGAEATHRAAMTPADRKWRIIPIPADALKESAPDLSKPDAAVKDSLPAAEDQKAANRAKLEEAKRKHEEAAADAASAEAKHAKAVAEVERETFTAIASLPAILNAAENSPDNFNIEADRQVAKWMAEQLSAAAASGDSQRAKAFDALFKDGRPVLPESFYAGLLKEAEQKVKARAAEQVKDAARTAMIQSSLQNGIIGDEDRAKFYDGWGHALAGKTKSTLSGEIPQKGYEAGRKWMQTDGGKAAASGKRGKKLENTGVDLRRWFDEQKAKIKEGDTETVLLALDGATNRAELFRNLVDSAQTPGAKRWVEAFRNKVLPFKRWLTEKGQLRNTWGEWSLMRRGASDSDKIRGYLDAKLHQQTKVDAAGYGKDQPREDRIKVLRQAAEEYVDLVTTLTDGLEGKTVQELATSLSVLMFKQGTATNPNDYYSTGAYKESAMELRDLLLKGKYDVDRFAWYDAGSSRTVRSLLESEDKESAPADRKAALTPPRLDRVDRDGEDYRKGKNITPQEFKKTLGFADVGFGKWVAAKQDQDHLNYAYDAFRDLAALLGIPPESVSLGGRLHFTIGALGHGKFAAHYQGSQPHPDGGTVPVINVTNTRGDGTVAHEWSHALDLTPQDGNEALKAAINELRADLTYAYDFGKMRSSVLSMLKGNSYWKGDKRASSSDAGKLDNAQRAIDYYAAGSKQISVYYQEAINLDGGGKKDPYWSNGKELFARAFEAWVTDRLEKSNTYLINPEWSGDGVVTKSTHRGTPYPAGEERERFNRWFDALAKSLRYEGKTLTVDADKWAANKPTDRADWKRMLADFKAELPSLLEGVKREGEAKAQAQKDAEAHAATMLVGDLVVSREATAWSGKYTTPIAIADIIKGTDNKTIYLYFEGSTNALAAEYFTVTQRAADLVAEAAKAAAAPEVKSAPTGELSESDLSALFDEAAAELQESKQEKPKAKAPGETMQKASDAPSADDMALFRKMVEDGKFVLLAGTDWARANQFPTIHDIALLVGTGAEVQHKGYGLFQVSKPGFEATFDGGGLMQKTPSGAAYTTLSVSRGEFANYPKTRVLEALTPAAAAKLPTTEQQQDKTASKLAAEAAKLGVQGIDEAMKGLVKLFGGGAGKLQSFPGGLDEATYKAAKPHFEASLKSFQDAGKSIKDLFKFLIEQFGLGIKPYAIRFAQDKALTANLGNQPTAYRKVGEFIQRRMDSGGPVTWQELFAEADQAFGGTQAENKYSVKDAYDAMEMGVNLWIRGNAMTTDDGRLGAVGQVQALTKAIQKLPTQTKRTAEQNEFQQFSTPPALSYVANWVANVSAADTMMEPSAGTGDLAIWSEKAGARLILNELSTRRAEILRDLFPNARVFIENAEQINNVLPDDAVPTVVVMNPPFSATAGRVQGKRDTNVGALHVEQALKRLANGGRLVAIVGEGMGADRSAFKDWWKKIQTSYNVRANIGISGQEYAKYGTTFDNQILVIDKTGPTTGQVVTGKVDSVADLPQLLEAIRNDRAPIAEQFAAEPAGNGAAETGRLDAGAENATGGGAADAVGAGGKSTVRSPGVGGRGNGQRASDLGQPDSKSGAGQPGATDATADANGQRGRVSGRPVQSGTGRSGGDAAGGTDLGTAGAAGDSASGLTVGATEREKASGEITDAVFENYQPQRLKIPGAKAHPGKLVQSSAMSAVEPPAPTYTPNLPAEVIKDGLLSLAQLEAIVYAGQAHSETLPNGERRGFFIGDGTGVGKGREISGIILDNLRQGRKKAVWISFSEGLINDAMRDFAGVGGNEKLIFWQGKTKPSLPITAKDGILFSSYSTLKSAEKKQANDQGQKQGRSRLDQIVEWLGPDFDGVIAFDEAHKMGNVIQVKGKRGMKKPSQQAIAGVNLQKALPKARILYVSATGATEVSNLGYASRLGLWGEGTAFADVKTFIGNVAEGGVAAMELISRDMKALGMYIARSLSFDGVTYERLEHQLTPLQTEMYDTLARAWQGVLQNVNEALKITDGAKNGNAKSAAMAGFWSSHQRFFNQVITSLQTPTVIEDMQKQIAAGHAVVVQLTNTNEATQEREVAKAQAEGTDLEELDFTPRQTLIEYVTNSFPVQSYQESSDADGNTIYVPAMDAAGNPVFDKDAIALREKLLSDLQNIRVPGNPIDEIIQAFGSAKVAEVTGRKRRFVQTRDEDGNLKVTEEKRGKHAAQNDAAAFQGDTRDVLIFSEAGGTGFSFHADNTAKNQRRRIHYILQPGWRADTAVQGFGRTHRTNQASEPAYMLPTTNLKAQKRFVSSIARRLDQLGALTRGQRQATSQGLFTASDNLESKYAEDALEVFFSDLYRGATSLNFHEVKDAMGLDNLIDKKTGGFNTSNVPEIPQFLNRLLSLESAQQDAVFGEFEKRLDEVVEFAIQNGVYDNGLQTLNAQSIKKVRDEVALTDQRTGAQTRFVEVDVTNPVKYRTWAKAKEWAVDYGTQFAGWFKSPSGRVFGMADLGERVNSKGESAQRGVLIDIQDGSRRYIDNAHEIKLGYHYVTVSGRAQRKELASKLPEDAAKAEWDKQVAASPKTRTDRTPMIVGVVLPIWDRVKGHPRIVRLQTDEGERMIGRLLSAKDVPQTLKNLGIGSTASKLAAGEVLNRINAGDRAILANQWEISKAMVSGENRIEIKPVGFFRPGDVTVLRDQGAFLETISWRERAFIPTGDEGKAVLARIMASKPVVDLLSGKADNDADLASRAPTTAGQTAAAVRAEVAAKIGKAKLAILERNGIVKIHDDYTTLPPAGQKYPNTWGYFDGKQTHLVASNLAAGQAAGVFEHEIWHMLLRSLRLSESPLYAKILDRLGKIEQNGAAGKWFAEAEAMIPAEDRGNARRRLNELAAYAIQQYENEPTSLPVLIRRFVQDLIASVRAFFMDTLGWVPDNLTAPDLAALTRRYVRSLSAGESAPGPLGGEALASRQDGGIENGDEEATIGDIQPLLANENDLDEAQRVFLSSFPESTWTYRRTSPTARLAKAASERARWEFGTDAGRTRRIEAVLGPFSGYETRELKAKGFGGKEHLIVQVYGQEQIEEGLDYAPALTLTVEENGEFSIYGPPSSSALYKHFAKRGWAEPTTDADGNTHETLDGGFWTKLTKTSRRQAIDLMGDAHARTLDWLGVENVGLHWKRTTGATGNKEGREGAIWFSRPNAAAIQQATDKVTDLFQTSKTFNTWHKTVGTQFHKASVDKDFGRVFKIGQQFLQDTSQFAMDAADLAPSLLPKLGSIKDVFKRGPKKADLDAVSKVVFQGTLDNKRFAPDELRAQGLNDKQIALYQEFRASIDKSIDDLFVSEMTRSLRSQFPDLGRRLVGMSGEDANATAIGMLNEALDEQKMVAQDGPTPAAKAKAERAVADLKAQIKQLAKQFNKVQKLKDQAYAPLTRFGQYTVDVVQEGQNGEPERVFFGMYESEREANAVARKFKTDKALQVSQGVMSQEDWRMFQGVSPDSLELFADALGADESEVFQKYLKLTLNNRSAMKRLIHRQGIAGFSQDVTRVLATFITSNSRLSARNLNLMPLKEAVEAIPKGKGDVKDEAVKLAGYLTDPKEEAQALRGWMFVHFIGGSVASAITNMTQPITMTAPYLAQWGAVKAGSAMKYAAAAMGKKSTGDKVLDAALDKAEAEGITAPHEIHQLYAESIRTLGSNAIVRKGLTAWGQAFALAEAFNRRITFIAAFKMAQQDPALGNPFAFAERAVEETQGIYNKGNRPDWARGSMGATIFTFKQFSISYVEFLKRLPPKQRALALAVLFLAAGLQGWPFAEDVQDLIDTIGQSFGYNTNSKRWMHDFAVRQLGSGLGEFATNGFSAIPGMPLDVQARMGLGNLIPGTSVFKLSEKDKSRDVLEFIGPVGSLFKSGMDSFSAAQQGRFGAAGAALMPVAIRNFIKAGDMVRTGEYRDTYGKKVVDVSGYDAAIKAVGFQPSAVAKESRGVFEQKQSLDMVERVESSIADRWAKGINDKDPGEVRKARADLAEWNAKNPESRIVIVPRQIAARVKAMRQSRQERFIKSTPPEQRRMVAEDLRGGR